MIRIIAIFLAFFLLVDFVVFYYASHTHANDLNLLKMVFAVFLQIFVIALVVLWRFLGRGFFDRGELDLFFRRYRPNAFGAFVLVLIFFLLIYFICRVRVLKRRGFLLGELMFALVVASRMIA